MTAVLPLRRAAVLLGALLLAGCGFQLRNSQNYAFNTIAVLPAHGSALSTALQRYLANSVQVVSGPAVQPPPDVVLEILQEKRDQTVVGLNASGQVREFELRLTVKFRLRSARGTELIEPTEILQQRDISYTESAALAKETEEAMLYRDMQADVVQQLLRRLAAVRDVAR